MLYIFAENVRKFRNEVGMTQSELSEELGISIQRLISWENGQCYPKMTMFVKLCEYMGYKDIYRLVTEKIPACELITNYTRKMC